MPDLFYLKLFLRPDVMLTYFKRAIRFREFPIKETMLVSNRPLTQEEFDYGATLEEEVAKILRDAELHVHPTEAGGASDAKCEYCGRLKSSPNYAYHQCWPRLGG